MEDLLSQALKQYGLPGVVILYLIWDKYQDRKETKSFEREKTEKIANGEWISHEEFKHNVDDIKSMQEDCETVRDQVDLLKDRLNDHLDKEHLEDIKIGQIELKQIFMEKIVEEIKDDQKEMFKMISAIKNHLLGDKT